jgi:uncharacterized protein
VPDDADVTARLTLESILDGALTATGIVSAPWIGECRRCLREVHGVATAEVREVFEPRGRWEAGSGSSAPEEHEGETYPLDGDHPDLEPLVRDAVLLTLPLAPLCEDACVGPDPDEHPVVVAEDPDAVEPDPRWGALGQLKFD